MSDLKDYKAQPDDGLFEKIERRLKVRRAIRIGGTSLAGMAVAGVAVVVVSVLAMQDKSKPVDAAGVQLAMNHEVGVVNEVGNCRIDGFTDCPDVRTAERQGVRMQMPVEDGRAYEPKSESGADASVISAHPNVDITLETEPLDSEIEGMLQQMIPEPVYVEIPSGRPFATTSKDSVEDDEAEAVVPKVGAQTPHMDNLIWAPNAIIPDGEVEENRLFSIKASSELTQFTIRIYNRRGMMVYSANDPSFVWDASGMTQGAYVWVATFRDTSGHPRQEKGTVVVVR